MITIAFLADYPDTIPTLAKWFRDQWPDYYAARSQEQIEQDFLSDVSRDRLPVRLIAFESSKLPARLSYARTGSRLYQGPTPN